MVSAQEQRVWTFETGHTTGPSLTEWTAIAHSEPPGVLFAPEDPSDEETLSDFFSAFFSVPFSALPAPVVGLFE